MVENIIPYIGGEEEKSEQEPLRIWGHIEGDVIVKAEEPKITCQCLRVPVLNGHTAAAFVKFRKKPTKEQLIEKLVNYKGYPQEEKLPMAPEQFIKYFEESSRNTIIYAHARSYHMFGGLRFLNKKTAWQQDGNNHFIYINTPYERTVWQLFAWYETTTDFNYIQTDFSSDIEYMAFLYSLRENNTVPYFEEVEFSPKSQILTLSTCKGVNSNVRVAMHAVLVKYEKLADPEIKDPANTEKPTGTQTPVDTETPADTETSVNPGTSGVQKPAGSENTTDTKPPVDSEHTTDTETPVDTENATDTDQTTDSAPGTDVDPDNSSDTENPADTDNSADTDPSTEVDGPADTENTEASEGSG